MSENLDLEQAEPINPLIGCLSLIALMFCIPIGALLDAWVMLRIYNWFLVSVPGAPPLILTNFMGISLIFGFLISGLTIAAVANKKKEEPYNFTKEMSIAGAKLFLFPLFVYLIADFYHFLFVR